MTSDHQMADSQQRAFLDLTLSFNPFDDPGRILNQCKQFAECGPDDVLVEVMDAETGDDYAAIQVQLKNLRSRFWGMGADERSQQVHLLETSPFPDVRAQGKRLRAVVSHVDDLRSLERQAYMDPKFFREFCSVLISSPLEANRIREAQLRWMRPVNNQGYLDATEAIQSSARLIEKHAPEVYQLERAWVNELLEFKPQSELADEGINMMLGWGVIIMVVALILAIIFTVTEIFDT